MQKIIAVDDHSEILNIITTKLSRNGYDVTPVNDATTAIETIRRIMPDLVLLDIMMPKITGFDLCDQIKSDPQLKDIKVVFLTAKDMDFTRKKADELKADGFIPKPFSPKELLSFINDLLGKTE
jgi:CheY-like chemotaxis protein